MEWGLFPPLQGEAGRAPGVGLARTVLGMELIQRALKKALADCGLPKTLQLYNCTRKTYGAHWVLRGGSMEKLSRILGHASVTTTERHYCHIRPDLFNPTDVLNLDLDMSRPEAAVIDLVARRGGRPRVT